jgi:hypothetical protein
MFGVRFGKIASPVNGLKNIGFTDPNQAHVMSFPGGE